MSPGNPNTGGIRKPSVSNIHDLTDLSNSHQEIFVVNVAL